MPGNGAWFAVAAVAIVTSVALADEKAPPGTVGEPRGPVLVELFTSEGCSSCPPADLLLERLDRLQPISGAQIIVLSEHVDYWNHLGWSDPYSSPVFSSRQEAYARRFRLESNYTPQMIVDGATEFLGSDWRRAESAIAAASKVDKVPVRLSKVPGGVRIEVDPPPASRGQAVVYFALAQDSAASDVLRGENKGRRLHHVAIVRRIQQVGSVKNHAAFAKDVPLAGSGDPKRMRIIVFVQEPGSGQVWGAAMLAESK
jgi:hypothetical protein